MTKLISSFNITIDGFCDHRQSVPDTGHNVFANELLKHTGAVIFGRTTYQLFEAFWPKAAKDHSLPKEMMEFGQLIDEAQKIVVSKTLSTLSWKNTKLIHRIGKEEIETLKKEFPKGLLIFGSPGLLDSLTKERAIDEYYFSVQPLIAGKGKRLFETLELEDMLGLDFIGAQTFQAGITTLHYLKSDKKTKLSF